MRSGVGGIESKDIRWMCGTQIHGCLQKKEAARDSFIPGIGIEDEGLEILLFRYREDGGRSFLPPF